ncbi:MAG: A24 family peptidase [Methanophagales archaeon ANME-1-THS]|nr:MAG: A24 family peptidase [Methanophagales archaeon ANME-1-THS]
MVGTFRDTMIGLYPHSFWKRQNPTHQIPNKFKYLNSRQSLLKTGLPKTAPRFLSFGFWYLVLFSISDLEFGILQLNDYIAILRLCIGSCLLCYASYSDVKRREVSDGVWLVMSASGVFLASLELFMVTLAPLQVVKSVLVGALFASLLYILNFGGADVKAMISIPLLFPAFPSLSLFELHLPVMQVPLLDIFLLSMLTNSLLIALVSPLSLFFYNLYRRSFSPLMFLGYEVELPTLRSKKHFKLMHDLEDKGSEIQKRYIWGGIEPTEEVLRRLDDYGQNKGIKKVWITPELPFIIYLTAGFFTAALYGDFISTLLF